MPIRPTGSFRRYLVRELQPRIDDHDVYEKLRDHRFRSIDDQAVAEPSIGWVASGTFGSSDFRPETVFLGKALRLRIRVDQKKLPTNAVKVRLAEAVAEMGGRVAKSARDQLRQEIEHELLGRAVPGTTLFEVYWRPQDRTVLLSSTSASAHDVFVKLFRETFGVSPEAATPTPLAEHAAAPDVTVERLRRLAPLEVMS